MARRMSWLTSGDSGHPRHSAKESLSISLRRGSVFSLAVEKVSLAPFVTVRLLRWLSQGAATGRPGWVTFFGVSTQENVHAFFVRTELWSGAAFQTLIEKWT